MINLLANLPAATPDAVRAARTEAGLSLAQAAALVGLGDRARWSEYERGVHAIDGARWALFLLATGRHPMGELAAR